MEIPQTVDISLLNRHFEIQIGFILRNQIPHTRELSDLLLLFFLEPARNAEVCVSLLLSIDEPRKLEDLPSFVETDTALIAS